ncbi:Hypothetical protein A7982_01133 [Minicystis rosea]|nr:Hypothetical protein A7982_01133 [Minicystis rosea]
MYHEVEGLDRRRAERSRGEVDFRGPMRIATRRGRARNRREASSDG